MNFSFQDGNWKKKVLRQEVQKLKCKIAEVRYVTKAGHADDKEYFACLKEFVNII
jgi:hypothetical protein